MLPFALAAAFLLAVGGYRHHQAKEEEGRALEAQKAREIAESNAKLEKLIDDLHRQQESMTLAQNELVTAQNDAERASAQAKLATAQQQARATQTQISSVRSGSKAAGGSSSNAKAACKCQPGDPLCACF